MQVLKYSSWNFASFLITCLVATPILILLWGFFGGNNDIWSHLLKTVIPDYIKNTLILIIGVCSLCIFIGVGTAWLTSNFYFPGSRFFNWGLLLPLSIPAYIIGYTYAGIFDFTGPIQSYTRNILEWETGIDIMSIWSVIIILALALYPYVFIICKMAFNKQNGSILDATKMLGKSRIISFFKIELPLIRPAIVGGTVIVIMEILNDYGAMKYYGINTFTTAICQVWFAFNDIQSAIRLSLSLMFIVLVIIIVELFLRGKAKYNYNSTSSKNTAVKKLKGTKGILAFLLCAFPLLFGFIIPVIQLISWSTQTALTVVNEKFWTITWNSFALSLSASILTVFFAIILVYAFRISKNILNKTLIKISSVGYILPGAVAAVGLIVPFVFIHEQLINLFGRSYDIAAGLAIGSIIMLILAYVIRFLVLGLNPIESTFEKMGNNIEDAAKLLGASSIKTLFKVDLPILKTTIIGSIILIFVNILKEIPLTIILRPFNFDTLAIKTFEMAKNEQIAESANLALIIILTSLIPVLFLNKVISKEIR